MPTYDFTCPVCNENAFIIIPISEDIPTPICFKCRGEMVRKYSVGSIQFKGTGWGKDA